MQPFPHHYHAATRATPHGDTTVGGGPLPDLRYGLPAEFGGSGQDWSPETLTVAAIAACFVLTFRAVARSARLEWTDLECTVSGSADKADDVHQFVAFRATARLRVPEGTDMERAAHLLGLAKARCLIANSFKAPCLFEAAVRTVAPAVESTAGAAAG